MKRFIVLLLILAASQAFGQSAPCVDPDGCYPVGASHQANLQAVNTQFKQIGTADEIWSIMHQSDYGYMLSDSILFLSMDYGTCLDAIQDGDSHAPHVYYCPNMLGSRVDSILHRRGNGDPDTREMCVQATALEKQRLTEVVEKWTRLVRIYRGQSPDDERAATK